MLLERDLFAVVPDGVEVQVEPALAVVEPDLAALPAQSFQPGQVAGAPDPVGVAGQVGGLGSARSPSARPSPGSAPSGNALPARPCRLHLSISNEAMEWNELSTLVPG